MNTQPIPAAVAGFDADHRTITLRFTSLPEATLGETWLVQPPASAPSPLAEAPASVNFHVHDALGNWMIEDRQMKRMIAMSTRERDAMFIAESLNAYSPNNHEYQKDHASRVGCRDWFGATR